MEEGEVAELWEGVAAENERLKHRHRQNVSSSGSSQLANASLARRAFEDGQYGKAIQSLPSDGLADATEDVFDEMLTKHPQAGPPCIPSDPVPPPLQVREMDVVRALQSSEMEVPQGLPVLEPIILRKLSSAPLQIVPVMLFVIWWVWSIIYVLAVCLIRILSPLQVGVRLPMGCEAIVHSVTSVQEDVSVPPDDRCTLLVDFSNTFNSVDREGMFRVVRARIPSMVAWLECCYGSQPLLHLGERTILSCCGVQQGDPLGPLEFALALHPIIGRKFQAF